LKRDQEKYEKRKQRGSLTEKEELKWSEKMLKHQKKSLKLSNDLEKAEKKLRKLD
jgi:hypothetical protein